MNIARKVNYALVGDEYHLISLDSNAKMSRNHVVIKWGIKEEYELVKNFNEHVSQPP